jgi:hypothetical protein
MCYGEQNNEGIEQFIELLEEVKKDRNSVQLAREWMRYTK